MSKAETNVSNRIRIALSTLGSRLFRNHRGKHLTLDGKRVVTTGLFPGASDLIGWTAVVVTPDMVGRKIAIFTSIEVKVGKGEATEDQRGWLDAVENDGGIACVARSEEEAAAAVLRVRVPLLVRV